MNAKDLLLEAEKAREASYAPYSDFAVGAALLASDGRVFLGCNVENASYSATCCAERVALFKALSEGVHDFAAIAVVGAEKGREPTRVPCYPCGVCRQVLSEFSDGALSVYTYKDGEPLLLRLDELLPLAFDKKSLEF